MSNKIRKLNNEIINFLNDLDELETNNIQTKLKNVCGKTGRYNVPRHLYQKRTARKNRVLIPYQNFIKHDFTKEQWESFEGGITFELLNRDYFELMGKTDALSEYLKSSIGSDDKLSVIISFRSVISFRSEEGSSSSAPARLSFSKFISNTEVEYKGKTVTITPENFQNYGLVKTARGGMGNEKWSNFLFVDIRGGQQDVITTHLEEELIFNPAVEYASAAVSTHIDAVSNYFALSSVKSSNLPTETLESFTSFKEKLEEVLENIKYDNEFFSGNLLEYVKSHPSIAFGEGKLTDPIQMKEIVISDFSLERSDEDYLNLTHDEAVNYSRFYWDKEQEIIVSAAQPANLSWTFSLSNMMQQDFTFEEYFREEQLRVERRKELELEKQS